ncbi:MAG: hypothetical protein ACXAD7_06115 [Candidatus Kariarchaeaceae archaeon]|jgi:hypothetical protein
MNNTWTPNPRNDIDSIEKYRRKGLRDDLLDIPELSKKPYVIIENNHELIEHLQTLLEEIVKLSGKGLEIEVVDEKNKILTQILKIARSPYIVDKDD